MGHTYANDDALMAFLQAGGADLASADLRELRVRLAALQSASTTVDEYCRRTGRDHPVSGFGPRIGTNTYDAAGGTALELEDDLLAATTVQVRAGTGDAQVAWGAGTDYLLRPYDRTPKRQLIVPDTATVVLGAGHQVVAIAGSWGYASAVRALVAQVGAGGWTAGATSLLVDDSTEYSPGDTILVDAEQVYVRQVDGLYLVVDRGVNGTTAATHTAITATALYLYPAAVADATLRLAQRRLKARDAGLAGDYGGTTLPGQTDRASELAILRGTVGHLAMPVSN